MSLRVVAQKYALDTHRTRSAWVATGLLVLVFGFLGWTGALNYGGEVQPLASGVLRTAAGMLIPLVTVGLGTGAVAGSRESGSLRVLLAYPHSRRDVVAGAFLGRLGSVLLAVVAGLSAAVLGYVARVQQLPGETFVVFAGFVLLWTVFAVSLAVGVSALVSTGRRAIGGTLGSYLLFLMGWNVLPSELVRRLYPRDEWYPPPEWVQIWNHLDPVSGYQDATALLLYGRSRDEAVAVYESLPFLAVVLAVWAVLPMAIALWRFPKADL